jgi:arabinofuranan 3-O-arabinosyltransferase
MATTASPGQRRATAPGWLDLAGLALLAYVPALLSSRGRVSADTKQYLYLDPGDFLARAPYLWDERVGAGGVSHQHIGYLWPMGPWFWLCDTLGIPTWVAQRLWLGTLALLAALGTRWLLRRLGLGRAGVLAGTLVYLLTPYQLAFSARTSVLLLPWVALPWLIALTDRAQRNGGWRDPAWIALIACSVGSVNASSLVLVGIGPAAWLLMGISDRASGRRALGIAGRVALLGAATSLWWIVALRLEAGYGLPVLQVTEKLEDVAATSSPSDVLRGLGNWYFYGRDRLGYSIDQAEDYVRDHVTVIATFSLSALALAAAIAVRWAHRARLVALVVVGTVVSVGAWPLDDPTTFGRAVADFTETSAGLALRNTARAAPIIVLGLAGLLGAAVAAWPAGWRRAGACAAVGCLALVGLKPVATTGLLSEHQDRVDPIPSYWEEAAADLDEAGTDTRVLELPGSNFSAFRWGNAVDPILPGLMERGTLEREVLPLGSPSSALLLDALDRRLQEGTLEPAAIAPLARLFAAGDVVVRSDLEYERFETPNPRALWALLTGANVTGLGEPGLYGDPVRNEAGPELPALDEIELAAGNSREEPSPVAVFPVVDPEPIVRTAPVDRPIVLSGDGDGIVDAAAAGLVDGRALVLQATSLPDDVLEDALDAGADLVVTDTYRRRIQTWFYAIRDTRGPTERVGETLDEPSGYDHRLDPTPWVGDDRRTVVEHRGGTVTASSGGGAGRPEDRATAAVDGDLRTAWRVGGADPRGARWRIRFPEPVAATEVTIVQPQGGRRDRRLTAVRVVADGRPPVDVELGEASTRPDGQVVQLPGDGTVRDLGIEITGVSVPPYDPAFSNAVGFAEVGIGDVTVREVVRVPTDLLDRADGTGHGLDLVLTRLRYEPGERDRLDQERTLERVLDLPDGRAFTLTGTVRANPNAPDQVLDAVLGTDLEGAAARATSHLAGDLSSRASRAFDGDPDTAWQSDFGPQDGQRLVLDLNEPGDPRDLTAVLVRDDRHSLPGTLTLEADGEPVGTVTVPDSGAGDTVTVELPDPPAGTTVVALVAGDVRARPPHPERTDPAETLPIAVAEVSGRGLPTVTDAETVPDRCRNLLSIDGAPVPVRVTGSVADARRGLGVAPCEGTVELDEGEHELSTILGIDRGLDVDRVVLSSAPGGGPGLPGVRGEPRSASGTDVEVTAARRGGAYDLEIDTDGEPFWLVLGQSDNRGWDLDIDGASVGERQIVDGYANGWLVTPDRAGSLDASLVWRPQRAVWIAMVISAAAVVLCIVLLVVGARPRKAARREDDPPRLAAPPAGRRRLTPGAPGLAVAVGVVALLVATPAAAIAASVAVIVGLAIPRATWAWLVIAPTLVLAARGLERPELAWVALALVAADLAVDRFTSVSDRQRPGRPAAQAP